MIKSTSMHPHNIARLLAATAIVFGAPSAIADAGALATKGDSALGLKLSHYNYREPDISIPTGGTPATVIADVKQTGDLVGVHGEKTWLLEDGEFLRLDGNFQSGSVDYTGSGKMNGQELRIYEVRVVYGVDEPLEDGMLSYYGGLGYRNLYNDARGKYRVGSTILDGYEREQQYTYLPVGVQYRSLWNNRRLTLTAEAGLLISGSNTSESDTMHQVFKQRRGYEIRLGAMVGKGNWEAGPYFQYWRVNDSEKNYENVGRVRYVHWEPRNTTVDVGLKIDRRF